MEDLGFVCDVPGVEEVGPEVAVAEADAEVVMGEAEGSEAMDEEGDGFGVGEWGGFAEDVAIELVEGAEAAFLWAFVAEAFGDIEPFDGFREGVGVGADHAG